MNETPNQPRGLGTASQPDAQNASVEGRPYSVVIVDDHAMFRSGVKAEIGRSVAVVGEAADASCLGRNRTWCCWTYTCRAEAVLR